MVYVDPRDIGYMPFWQRWLGTRESEPERELLR